VNLASQQTQQRFPFPYDDVFAGLVAILPEAGMTVKSQDKVIGRVTASAGMSLFSWGESIAIVVQPLDEKATIVGIESSLKFGANVAGAQPASEELRDDYRETECAPSEPTTHGVISSTFHADVGNGDSLAAPSGSRPR
jgi:hypothetical protein